MADINFIPPTNSNNAIMVNDDNVLTNPNVNDFLNANKEIAKASDITGFKKNIDSLTNKTQNITASVGKTTFSGSITSGSILSNNIDVSGNLNVEGTLKASNIGSLIGKSLSVENLTVTDTLTAENFEVDIPDTILNVEGVKSKGIIEANNFQETNPNKFVKGWFLARVEDSENDGNKNIYISNKQYSYDEITSAELPSDFETADFSNISVNDVFYFYNSRHFPYAFRVISIHENYLKVKEINDGSLTIGYSDNLSSFRYGLFIIGTWNASNNSVVFSNTKIDAGYANFYNNVLAIGDDNSLGYNSCSTGTSCSSIGMYSNCIGNGNVAISYSSIAFGQKNFVLGEKCSAIGANNNIEGGNGNVAFGYNNKIYSSNVGTTISESSVALGQGIKIDTTIHPKISFGQYNVDDDNIIFSVGNGTSDNNRSNAFEVYRDGSFSSPILENLQLFKANTGALHFNGGYAQCSKLLKKQQFSFAVRIKANKNDVLIKKQVNIIDMGVFYLYIHPSVQRLSVYTTGTGNSLKSVTVEQNDRIFDGKWHSLFVIYDGTTLTLLDEFGVLLSSDYSIQEQTSNTKIGTNFVGEMSNVCLFNFDITSADALYTISDYQQGKPIPPNAFEYLNQNVAEVPIDTTIKYSLSATLNNTISHWDRPATISVNGDAITWTATTATDAGTSVYPKSIVYKFAKAFTGSGILKIDVGNVSKNGTLVTMRIIMFDITGAVSYPSDTGFGFDKGPLSLNIPYTNGLSAIAIGTGSSWSKGDSFTIDYLKVEHNGTILALEDYTINGKVLDYSGNKNHAKITGYVKGDNDTRIEAFVEEITTSTSEQN